jgi:hypothetical protein
MTDHAKKGVPQWGCEEVKRSRSASGTYWGNAGKFSGKFGDRAGEANWIELATAAL